MSFLLKINEKILHLQEELKKVRQARLKKDFYITFVSQKINDSIRSKTADNPDNPIDVFRDSLTRVSEFISEAFVYIERVESNIIITLTTYENIKNELIAYENQKNQEKSIAKESKKRAKKNKKLETDKIKSSDNKIRKIGKRPVDKLKNRKIAQTKDSEKI